MPLIRFDQTNEYLLLEAVIGAVDLPQNIAGKPFQLGLTAVIEANEGNRIFWSLQRPEAHADFHHCAGFISLFNQS